MRKRSINAFVIFLFSTIAKPSYGYIDVPRHHPFYQALSKAPETTNQQQLQAAKFQGLFGQYCDRDDSGVFSYEPDKEPEKEKDLKEVCKNLWKYTQGLNNALKDSPTAVAVVKSGMTIHNSEKSFYVPVVKPFWTADANGFITETPEQGGRKLKLDNAGRLLSIDDIEIAQDCLLLTMGGQFFRISAVTIEEDKADKRLHFFHEGKVVRWPESIVRRGNGLFESAQGAVLDVNGMERKGANIAKVKTLPTLYVSFMVEKWKAEAYVYYDRLLHRKVIADPSIILDEADFNDAFRRSMKYVSDRAITMYEYLRAVRESIEYKDTATNDQNKLIFEKMSQTMIFSFLFHQCGATRLYTFADKETVDALLTAQLAKNRVAPP